MKPLNLLERLAYWIDERLARYNCEKDRHRWVYTLSESGKVYLNNSDVPKELWHCSECGMNQYD
jgi:hypothetical protein